MSNFITMAKHPVDGGERQCFALDDFFGPGEYGYWFAKKSAIPQGEKLDWDTPRSSMEDVAYADDGVRSSSPPDWGKIIDKMISESRGDRKVTGSPKKEPADTDFRDSRSREGFEKRLRIAELRGFIRGLGFPSREETINRAKSELSMLLNAKQGGAK